MSISQVLREEVVVFHQQSPTLTLELSSKQDTPVLEKAKLESPKIETSSNASEILDKKSSRKPANKTKIAESVPKPPPSLPPSQKVSGSKAPQDEGGDSEIEVVEIEKKGTKKPDNASKPPVCEKKRAVEKGETKPKGGDKLKQAAVNKEEDLVSYFSDKFNTLDLMGLAVVNTGSYLKEFEKIFW